MSERKQPETSLEAYRSLTIHELNDTYRKILSSLGQIGSGTFEDIAAHAKLDKSRVWKRMSELERMELVYRPGTKKLLKSGRNGFTWSLTNGTTPKTEKTQKELLAGTKTIAETTKEMQGSIKKAKALQLGIFSETGA